MTILVDETQLAADPENYHLTDAEDMGSFNHSYLQAKLTALFLHMPEYLALTELSLDTARVKQEFPAIGDSIVPDLAIYTAREINLARDTLRMTEMPLLAVEILSPMQAAQILVDKIALYFALGVRSCWIVYPTAQTVSVFSAPYEFQSFSSGQIYDRNLDLSLAWEQIFT